MSDEYINIFWIIAGIALGLLELTHLAFILVFLGVSAFLVGVLGFIFPSIFHLNVQIISFIILSVGSLLIFRKKVTGALKGKIHSSTYDSNPDEDGVGEVASVYLEILPDEKKGKVEWRGTLWDAESTEKIEKGMEVIIIKREGLSLIVKRRK